MVVVASIFRVCGVSLILSLGEVTFYDFASGSCNNRLRTSDFAADLT